MSHAWVDASAGIAGDMLLGALLDAGADLAAVQASVDAVVSGSVRIEARPVTRAGMRATKADVRMLVQDPPHRTWSRIAEMLADADLPSRVRTDATAVFARLAEAEGRAHGIDPADVHFHEVGALDSIADVVGVCAALHDLGVRTLTAGETALGSGMITMAHGTMAVPGPAVTELSRGWQVTAGGAGELTTPTGMALVVTLAQACEPLPSMIMDRSGSGAGTKDVAGRPNVTRVIIGERQDAVAPQGSAPFVLEANVDDLDPRLWPDVLLRLIAAGAYDAWLVPIIMKKGRPAHVLTVLCEQRAAAPLRELIFTLTSTIGVRQHPTERFALARTFVDVELDGVAIPVKVSHDGGVIRQVTAEFDAVARHAAATGQAEQLVLARAAAAAVARGLVPGAPLPDR